MLDLPGALSSFLESLGAQSSFKTCWGFVCGVLGAALGGVWTLFVLLLALMLLDYALGFCRAWNTRSLRRSKAMAGVAKFLFYTLAWFVAALVEASINESSPVKIPVRDVVIGYLCMNEGLSCFEHLAFFGVPLPTGLRSRLREYRDTIGCGPATRGADGR